jgi:hypothetical protein
MKSQNKQSFEEEWKNAFNDTEQVPDDALWARLDSYLANKEALKYKKKLRYLSIAASLALLLISLGFTAWWYNHAAVHQNVVAVTPPSTVQRQTLDKPSATEASGNLSHSNSVAGTNEAHRNIRSENNSLATSPSEPENKAGLNSTGTVATASLPDKGNSGNTETTLQPLSSRAYKLLATSLPALEELIMVSPSFLAALNNSDIENPLEDQQDKKKNKWWVAASFNLLYYNPNFSVNYDATVAVPMNASGNFSMAFKDITQPDFSYVASLETGYRISRRWSIKSGLQYLYYNSRLNTRAFFLADPSQEKVPIVARMIADKSSTPVQYDNAPVTTAQLNNTENTITLQNQYQYLGIPVQGSFSLNPDKQLSIALSAGLATDIFLQNVLKSDEENLQSASTRTSDNSVYRSVNFSGLLGFEINYRLNKRYQLSLEPLCRAALHPTTISGAKISSRPLSAGIGFGMKYNF